MVGASVAMEQMKVLSGVGVKHFYFYIVTRAELTHALCHLLVIPPKK